MGSWLGEGEHHGVGLASLEGVDRRHLHLGDTGRYREMQGDAWGDTREI